MKTHIDLELSSVPLGLDSRLPYLVGLVVMLSAQLERVIAVIAMSVENEEQNHYLAQDVASNLRVIRRRLPKFKEPWQRNVCEAVLPYLSRVEAMLGERNEIVHRVWTFGSGDTWGGHKGHRGKADPTAVKDAVDAGWLYNPQRFEAIVKCIDGLVSEGNEIFPRVTAFPRLEEV